MTVIYTAEEAGKVMAREEGCCYVYNGRNGGKPGQICKRPESEHCHGRSDSPDALHEYGCRLFIADDPREPRPDVRPGRMVHHPYHRRKPS
jgi:hypothetical protein